MRWLPFLVLFAAVPPSTPHPIAVTNATLVISPGRALERASVLLRDGLIQDVGPGIEIPKDAEVVDGAGLTVYAGFIDAHSTIGLPDTKRTREQVLQIEGEKPDFTREAPPHMEQANRKGLRPEFDAAEEVHVTEDLAKKAHAGGFTVARVAATDEYLSGRSALVSLSGEPRRNTLLRGLPALHAGFKTYLPGYPTTLMGVLAHLRQVLLDGRHQAAALEAWKPGRPRIPVDAALDALQPALRGEMPVCFAVDTDRDILRAFALADEFGLKVEIAGGEEAWKVAGAVKAHGAPVLLSLKLPKEPEKKKEEEPEPARLTAERARRRAEQTDAARVLYEKRVRFCFSSTGLASAGDALTNLATLIEKGLPTDAAIAALTTTPAKLFGIDATHGSIEKGKAATLTVLSAPLGDKSARVKFVVVDGRRFEVDSKAPEEKPKGEKKEELKLPLPDYAIETDQDRVPKTTTGGTVLLKGATILTVAEAGTIGRGSIYVREGKIVAVGADVTAPEDVRILDVSGLTVMPGIIDCHSHIAMEGGLNESSQTITPEVRVRDALDSHDVELYRAAAGGVTAANILHGSANAIGGQNAVIKLKYRAPAQQLLFPGAPRGVKFALGENPTQANFADNRGKRFPNTRMGVEAAIRRAFLEAREYEQSMKKDPLTRRDLRLDALLGVLQGEILVHCHCYRADEILMILGAAKANGFRVATLQHALEAYRVTPEIAASGAAVSTFSDWWSYKVEANEAIPYNAALVTREGISCSINSDLPHQIRHLNVEAAKTMKYGGLSEAEALAQVTINPARQLGIEKFAGSIEAGKAADLAFYRGHPFSPYSRCVLTLIDGEVVFEKRDVPDHSTPDFQPSKRPRQGPAPRGSGKSWIIANATIHPVSAPPFVGGLVMADGKIVSLYHVPGGPTGPPMIDATGLHVYPGMIDAHTSIGLSEIGSIAGTRDQSEIGLLQPDLRALSAVNPNSDLIEVTRANGITSALSRPSGGWISGQGAAIRLAGWTPAEMAIKEVCSLHVAIPRRPHDGDKPGDKKADAEQPLKSIRAMFEDAKRYDPAVPDPRLEALQPYLRGELPVLFEADSIPQIRDALKLAADFGLKPVISGGEEAWKVAGLLAEKKVPVILAGVMGIPGESHDPADAQASSAAILAASGVRVAISSAEDYHGGARNTPYHAAWAAAHGLDRDLALKAVTLYPAEILGIADRVGSIDVGKDADLIVTTGDPLEVLTDVVYEFIAGTPVSLESKHTRLYDKFKERGKAK
ncbi:MAG TPA: amidohydrolase family protein [Planctomycetota bacterium]|nr:amidohydrolase family protein [Planctomycetota bacterium]